MHDKPRFKFLWLFIAAFILLQLLDGILTTVGIYLYGSQLEGNPIAALLFKGVGLWQGAVLAKVYCFLVFFGLLWYCIRGRWSTKDIFRMLRGEEPKRDRAYAIKCFYLFATLATLAFLYAGGGWLYILIYLGTLS